MHTRYVYSNVFLTAPSTDDSQNQSAVCQGLEAPARAVQRTHIHTHGAKAHTHTQAQAHARGWLWR